MFGVNRLIFVAPKNYFNNYDERPNPLWQIEDILKRIL
jgi:hypothetical protein